jgi:DNA-binding NarL/FixJ family response regulator
MIVDDHAETRAMIRQVVGNLATEICECSGGVEAVRQCSNFRPDFVTVDLNMQPMTGFETTRQLMARHPSATVVVVTSFDHAGLRNLATRSGAKHFILKEDLAALRRLIQHNPTPENSEA